MAELVCGQNDHTLPSHLADLVLTSQAHNFCVVFSSFESRVRVSWPSIIFESTSDNLQFLQPVADIDLGPLAQRLMFCQEQEQNSVNSSTPAHLPGTLPLDLHDITDTSIFRKRLKNVLFDGAYN